VLRALPQWPESRRASRRKLLSRSATKPGAAQACPPAGRKHSVAEAPTRPSKEQPPGCARVSNGGMSKIRAHQQVAATNTGQCLRNEGQPRWRWRCARRIAVGPRPSGSNVASRKPASRSFCLPEALPLPESRLARQEGPAALKGKAALRLAAYGGDQPGCGLGITGL